jgi:hypothetical protein
VLLLQDIKVLLLDKVFCVPQSHPTAATVKFHHPQHSNKMKESKSKRVGKTQPKKKLMKKAL